jgi:hypothetical protein
VLGSGTNLVCLFKSGETQVYASQVIDGACSLNVTSTRQPSSVEVYETYKNQMLFKAELTFDSRYGPQLDSISPQWVYLSDEPKYVKLLGSGF